MARTKAPFICSRMAAGGVLVAPRKNGNERRINPNRLTALALKKAPSHLLHRHNEFDRTVLVRFRGKHGAARLQITPVQRAIDAVEG